MIKTQSCKTIERGLGSQFHLQVSIPLCLVLIKFLYFYSITNPFIKTINPFGHSWL